MQSSGSHLVSCFVWDNRGKVFINQSWCGISHPTFPVYYILSTLLDNSTPASSAPVQSSLALWTYKQAVRHGQGSLILLMHLWNAYISFRKQKLYLFFKMPAYRWCPYAVSSFYEPKDTIELSVALVSHRNPPCQRLHQWQDNFLDLTPKIQIPQLPSCSFFSWLSRFQGLEYLHKPCWDQWDYAICKSCPE